MTPTDLELQTRVTDPNDPVGTTSVRVWFTIFPYDPDDTSEKYVSRNMVQVYGIFRLGDDSEIDFKSLSGDDQNRIEEECEEEYRKQNEK